MGVQSRMRHCKGVSSQFEQLANFPEYNDASKLIAEGSFHQALPLVQRMNEVIASSVGSDTALAAATRLRLAAVHRLMGDRTSALASTEVDGIHGPARIYLLLGRIGLLLEDGQFDAADAAAIDVVQLTEAQPHEQIDISTFCGAYTAEGLAAACKGRLEDAEDAFQRAARWGDEPVDQLLTSLNLGRLHWWRGDLAAKDGDTAEATRQQDEAVAYWEEGVQLGATASTGGAAAATMACSPGGAAAADANAAGAGAGAQESKDAELATSLADPEFLQLYSVQLVALARAYAAQGSSERAAEYLSAAVASFPPHSEPPAQVRLIFC
jgi:tetratricopeptide (TPR) repeat protein